VIQVEGVLNKKVTDSSLEKVNDVVLTQSVFGRMFGFGDLEILTASESGISRFRMLVEPVRFKRAMLDAKHEYERDISGAGYAVGPPLRVDSAGPGEPPTDETVSTALPPMPAAAPLSRGAHRAWPDNARRLTRSLGFESSGWRDHRTAAPPPLGGDRVSQS